MSPGKDEVRVYRHDPAKLDDAVAAGERRIRVVCAVLAAVVLAAAAGGVAFAPRGTPLADPVLVGAVFAAATFVVVGFVYFSTRRDLRTRIQRDWEAYCLAVSANAMRYADGLTVPVEIVRPQVVRISEQAGVGLTVATVEAGRFLFLPVTLGGYGELREHLSRWRPIEGAEPWAMRLGRTGWYFAQIPLTVCSWIISDLRISGPFALGAVIAGVLAIRQIRALAAASEDQKALLVRGPRYFLLATVLRFVLLAGHALSERMGGPSLVAP